MDPLTISTGVLACISISLKVLVGLKQLKANVGDGRIGSASIDVLADDISGLRQVLESTEEAFQDVDDDRALGETGHAGAHWRDLRRCLNDEHAVLSDFDEMLFDLNKKVKVLAPSRMESRLQSAAARFVLVGKQVQAYKDAFRVSLNVLILSNCVSLRESASSLESTAKKQDTGNLMAKLQIRIQTVEDAVSGSSEMKTLDTVSKLKQCAASAASLFSSHSTPTPTDTQPKTGEPPLPSSTHHGVMEWINNSSVDGNRLQTPPSEDSGFESASPQTPATQLSAKKATVPAEAEMASPTPSTSLPPLVTLPAELPASPGNHSHHHHPPHGHPQHRHGPGPVIMYMAPVGWNGQNQNNPNGQMSPVFPVQVIYGPPPAPGQQRPPLPPSGMPFRASMPPPSRQVQHSHRPTSSASPAHSPGAQVRQQERQERPPPQPAVQPPPKVQPKLQLRTPKPPQRESKIPPQPTPVTRPQPSYGNSNNSPETGSATKQKQAKLQKQPKGERGDKQAELSWDPKNRGSMGQPFSAKRKSQNPFTGLRRLMPGSGENLPRRQKLCFVGDSGCGKTCLLTTTTKGTYPQGYEPTTFENYVSEVDVRNGAKIELEIWDTAGQELYDNLRALSYPDSHALVMCFSIGDPLSYHHVLEKWLPEATRFCPETPIFVVGCKQDLRFDHKTIAELQRSGQLPLTTAEGLAAAGRIGAKYYIETSAKTSYGIDNLLAIIADEVLKTSHAEPASSIARRFHEDARLINEERRNLRASGEILTPREKEYASKYVRVLDEPNSTVWRLQEHQIVDKGTNASRSSFFRKAS